ncbi:unnamed protein product [Cuscuta campestris]|uniref:Uncharacterized protein n=1 Tax=Cuscuta campestris TaxID=132261 RepID=A0A484LTP5_9ASTE|nr:unnamed protein product [Cuscuta campestris]
MGDALTDQEFNQYISGRGDANLETLESLFEEIDEAGMDGDEEPTPHSNDVDHEACEPETSQGPDKVLLGPKPYSITQLPILSAFPITQKSEIQNPKRLSCESEEQAELLKR